jgi:hypothetical protein
MAQSEVNRSEEWHKVKWIALSSLFTITNWLVLLVWDASGQQWATNANIYGDWHGYSVAPHEFEFLPCSACRHGLSMKSQDHSMQLLLGASSWTLWVGSLAVCSTGMRPDATWIEVAMSRGIQPTNARQQLCPAGHHNSQGRLAAICYCHGSTTLKKNSCFHNFTIYTLIKEQYIITFQQDTGYIHVKMTKAPATSMCGDMRHPLG